MYINTNYRTVKSEDLNTHKTLYAGRLSDWMVESTFISVITMFREKDPKGKVVMMGVDKVRWFKSSALGDIIHIENSVAFLGNSRIILYSYVYKNNDRNNKIAEGFFTYVSVDDNERPRPHMIKNNEPKTEEEKRVFEIASNL